MKDVTQETPAVPMAERKLPPAAQRALAEASERRKTPAAAMPPEQRGRGGLEPGRYGDWEVKGLTSDF